MAEEELVCDHKRKHEDLEPEAPQPPPTADSKVKSNEDESESESVEKAEEEEAVAGDESDAKRPRLEDGLVIENGFQKEKVDETSKKDENTNKSEVAQQLAVEAPETVNNEQQSTDDHQTGDMEQLTIVNPQFKSTQQQPSGEELQEPLAEFPQQIDVSSMELQLASETQTTSRKMEVPNNKVGILIGKAGETIKFLQFNSGTKIQITRDTDADPSSDTRPVELIGTMENINKAEKLIKDVIAEVDIGGSASLIARGFSNVQTAGAGEQILMQVPNEKVGLIIGKGGETIKSLQTRSGARIQLIPQHVPEGDQSKERTVCITGDKTRTEMAREMIKEVMNQTVRSSPLSGGYNQKGYRQRGPASQQWGPRGPHRAQSSGYDYQRRGPYPSQSSQYPPQAYGNYPPQQVAPRSGFGKGWEQRPSTTMQGSRSQSGGYDYYGGQGHMDTLTSVSMSNPVPAQGLGPSPASMFPPQGHYNYGQPHRPEYGQAAPYSQSGPPESYGHRYNEAKYENQAPSHYPYGEHGGSQPGAYQVTHPGYASQDQYGKPSYGMPPHGPSSQSYGQPRPSQPGDIPYQVPISSAQPYGQNAQPQAYPCGPSGPMQQSYPPYGSASATDGYNQPLPATGSAPVYPQQGGQPVPAGYGQQPVGQQAPSYAQVGPTGGYGSYPSSQAGYAEQPAQNNAGYGYQGAADPAYSTVSGSGYGAPTGQAGYAQPAPTQPGYDQSVPHSGAHASVPGVAPVGYGKSLSPQSGYPQYDSSQMYGAPH